MAKLLTCTGEVCQECKTKAYSKQTNKQALEIKKIKRHRDLSNPETFQQAPRRPCASERSFYLVNHLLVLRVFI